MDDGGHIKRLVDLFIRNCLFLALVIKDVAKGITRSAAAANAHVRKLQTIIRDLLVDRSDVLFTYTLRARVWISGTVYRITPTVF